MFRRKKKKWEVTWVAFGGNEFFLLDPDWEPFAVVKVTDIDTIIWYRRQVPV